ncbi:MAG: TonB-dependent receptor [Xanthomonadales bacterium]|nr:TonB-dependent receptor [Gammaproteobacteria bacterium]NNL03778.1 TonB-dependent receptor [Xanthomonadales bacterium]
MNPYQSLTALLCCGALASASALASQEHAQTQPEAKHEHGTYHGHDEIEEVVVQATPLQRSLGELSQSATILSGESLHRELANNIGETLTRQAGLANASFGQNVGRPVIRGLQGQRVGVLSNNMSASDASAVSQDHAVAIEPFLADQIEVLRGPATLLYGSGAIGGVVNIVSHTIPEKVPADGFDARAMAQLDSAADQRFAAGRIDFGTAGFAFHADGFYRRTDDYEIPGAAELYPDEEEHGEQGDHDESMNGLLENSFLDNQGGSLGASWIGERWRLGLSWSGYESDYGIPGAHHHHHEEEGMHEEEEEEELVTVGLDSRRWDTEVVGNDPFAGFGQLSFRFANTDYTHTEFEGEEIGTTFDSDTNDVRLELRHLPWGRWSGAFGLQYTDTDFTAVGEEAYVPPSNSENAALFWIESAEFGSWQVDLGLRYEDVKVTALEQLSHEHHQDEEEHDEGSLRRSFSPFSISAGAIWQLREDRHLSFSLSRAERAPTAPELFAFGPHVASQTFEIGDSSLRKESNLHGEIGYRVSGDLLSGSLVVYVDRFDDYIYQQNTGEEEDGFPLRQWSQQDADFIGAEIELRYDIGHYDSGHWWIFGLFDYVDGELADGHNVPLMPPMRFGGGLDWHRGAWQANLTWIHADDHSDVADYETPTPGYDLLNAEITWRLPFFERAEWDLFFKGHNLLDEDIRNSTSYLKDQAPQIGRNFILGLRLSM